MASKAAPALHGDVLGLQQKTGNSPASALSDRRMHMLTTEGLLLQASTVSDRRMHMLTTTEQSKLQQTSRMCRGTQVKGLT